MGTHGWKADLIHPPPSKLVTLATSHDGQLIATACKASTSEHAVVRVVSTTTWELFGEPLNGHNLTITRISFSHDDQRIISCSRDRGWRMFKRTPSGVSFFDIH